MALASYAFFYCAERAPSALTKNALLQGLLIAFMIISAFSYDAVFGTFKKEGHFHAPWNVFYSVIDLRGPFVLGDRRNDFSYALPFSDRRIDFPYLGILEEERMAQWLAERSENRNYHGMILHELSFSRNALYNMFVKQGQAAPRSGGDVHYVGVLRKDLDESPAHDIVFKAGALDILKTVPKIDDSTVKMSYRMHEGWFKRAFDDAHWTSLSLPVYTVENPIDFPPSLKSRWSEETLYVRMNVRPNTDGRTVFLGIGFPSWDPFSPAERIEEIYLNDAQVGDVRKTTNGWIARLSELKKEETNVLAVKLKVNRWSDLDLYTW